MDSIRVMCYCNFFTKIFCPVGIPRRSDVAVEFATVFGRERGLSCYSGVRSFAFLFLLIPLAADVSWGSAFSIAEQGAKAPGMGTAFTSIADDGSAFYYNPAGLAFQPGTHMEMDAIAVVGLFRFFPSATQPGVTVPGNGYSGSVKPHFIPVGAMAL